MIKIGAVNIDISHPRTFAKHLLQGNRARYKEIYNDGFRDDAEVEEFITKYGLEKRCQSIDELADKVDVGFIHDCNWQKHLDHAMPFIRRGKPVFIDKPIVGSEADCRRLEALVKKGAVIYGSSSVRYCRELDAFMQKPEAERGKIIRAHGMIGSDEFNYAVHAVEGIGTLLGTGALSCRIVDSQQTQAGLCETYLIKFHGDVTAMYTTFIGNWRPSDFVIMTTKTTTLLRVDSGSLYSALLDKICDSIESRQSQMAPVKALTESVRIMLAGRLSKEQGGAEVALIDIPVDDPGFDGDAFEREYAEKAKQKSKPGFPGFTSQANVIDVQWSRMNKGCG